MNKPISASRPAHWTEGEQVDKSPRGLVISLLVVFVVTAFIGLLIFIFRSPPPPQKTVFQAWYVADYDDRVLLDLPFSESSTKSLADVFGGQAEKLSAAMIRSTGLADPRWKTMDQSADVAVVYIRAYAAATHGEAQQLRAEILTNGFAGDVESEHCVSIREICDQLNQIPASAVILLLDCAELEHAPSLGVLANGFPLALEEELKSQNHWDRLWVINCNSLLQRAHISWQDRQTLMVASLTQADPADFDVMEKDGSISLAELYDGMLRICAEQSDEKQTPVLFRGRDGIVKPSENNPAWREASRIPVLRLAATSSEDDPQADNNSQIEVATAPTNNLPPSDAAQPIETADSSTETTAEPKKRVSFEEHPLQATWAARDRLWQRQTRNQWSPADYAPGIWGRIQHQLIALDQQLRLQPLANNDTSELGDLHNAFVYLEAPNGDPPNTSNLLAKELLDSYQRFEQFPTKRQWERDDDLRPTQIENWKEIKNSLRAYADANVSLPWWLDLAAHMRDRQLSEHTQALQSRVRQFNNEIEIHSGAIEPTAETKRRLSISSREIQETVNKLNSRLMEIATARLSPWGLQWNSTQLLRSPLIDWSTRERLLQTVSSRGERNQERKLLIQRVKDLADVYRSTHDNRGEASGGWLLYEGFARQYETLIGNKPPSEASIQATSAALDWGKWYREQLFAQAKQETSGYSRWRSAAVLGAALAQLEPSANADRISITDPANDLYAIVIPPVLDDSLQAKPQSPETLVLSSGDSWESLEAIQLNLPGEDTPQEFRLTLANEVSGNIRLWEALEIQIKEANDQWRFLRASELGPSGEGVRIELPRDSKLEFIFRAKEETATLEPSNPLTIPLLITPLSRGPGQRQIQPAKISVKILPPRPNQIDMWISTYSPAQSEERQRARRNLSVDTLNYGLFAKEQGALVSIASDEKGIPYRLWLENQSREPKWVRVSLYPLDVSSKGVVRPGRVLASGGIPSEVKKAVDAILADKASAWAQCIPAQPLPPKPDQQPGNRLRETVAAGNQARQLSDSAILLDDWKILTPNNNEPKSLSIPNGFVCLIEEMEPPQAIADGSDAETSPLLPTKELSTGKHWIKLIEVATHPMLEKTDVDLPLLDLKLAARYDQARGSYRIGLDRINPAAWARYQVKTLPFELTFPDRSPDSLRIAEPLRGELSSEITNPSLNVLFEPQPRPGQAGIIALSLGGYPRRYYYKLVLNEQGRAFFARDPEVLDARMKDVVPSLDPKSAQKFEPQESPFAELRGAGDRNQIVLLHSRTENNRPVRVDYSHIDVAAEIDAKWDTFREFADPQRLDRVSAVLSRDGTIVAAEHRFSPRHESFWVFADNDPSILRLRSSVADHSFQLPPPEREGRYQAYVELKLRNGADTSEKQTIIVDQSPPLPGIIKLANGKQTGGELYDGEKFEVQLETEDKYSRVRRVKFAIRLSDDLEIPLDKEIGSPDGKLWKTTVSSDALGERPEDYYTIIAEAEDLAGNMQTEYTGYRFRWMNKPRPTAATATKPTTKNGVQEEMAEGGKQYSLVLKFTRGPRAFPIVKADLIAGIQIAGLKGNEHKDTKSIAFTEIPAGEYKVEFSTSWEMGNFIAEKTIEMPRDNGKEISIHLTLEPKEDKQTPKPN